MGHYPHQDFYYGFLARYTGDDTDEIWEFFKQFKSDGEERERTVNFKRAGDHTRHLQERGVVGVEINDKYGPGEKVVENVPDKRDEYGKDMSYLGGFHTGEFDMDAFKRELDRAKQVFEEKNVEEKLRDCEFLELLTAQPSVVTVSWFG